ncbi:MAG: chloride channel protein [Clostridia bacterium]|nr:chloride channel protein [Clostridia bacterium]
MKCSERIYGFVRENPAYLPLLIIGAVLVGGIAALILKYAKECRGGGITTAIAAIRGLIPLKWIQGIFALFTSSLLTYLAGIPLGNEGPSVQMGAAVGEGSAHLSGKKKLALERYLMTGGASSGFAIATGAPFTGIIFAIEEAHRRISAPLLMVASISVISGTVTHRYLSFFSGVNTTFFDLSITKNLPARFLWVAIIIGAVCGMSSYLFTKLYRVINKLSKAHGGKIPFSAKIMVIFAFTAVFGFFSVNFIGTGHSLIENILHARPIWYVIILAFVIRALLMICANNEGVSGGMFVPNLAFGAMIASLIMELFISIGAIDEEYYTILVIVGMASFLVASSRAPITSIAFAAEALCVASNILPVIMGVITSYIIAEFSDKKSFTETVIESRAESAHEGKDPVIVYSHMTVGKHSFADGMEIRDIIWPPTCAVLSIDRKQSQSIHDGTQEIREGDELHLHYQTYDPEKTLAALISILGEQPDLFNENFVQKIGRILRRFHRMWKFRSLADENYTRLVWNSLIFNSYIKRDPQL